MDPEVRFGAVDGVRIRYSDSGGSQQTTVVLTSPWPESLYALAPVWARLAERARLFAVDLPRVIDAGHFGWEEVPAEYASTILESTKG